MTLLPATAQATTPDRPVAREPLHLKTARRIRVMIVQGTLAPGSRVMEHALCQQFGVSRTPLREALKVLAAEGLVQLRHSKGTWVTPLDREQLCSLFEVIEPLGRKVGDLAQARADDDSVTDMESLCQTLADRSSQVRSDGGGESKGFLTGLWDIHLLLGRMPRNRALLRAYQECLVKILRACFQVPLTSDCRDRWLADIEAIAAGLTDRTGPPLGEIVAAHWRHVETEVGAGLAPAQGFTPDPAGPDATLPGPSVGHLHAPQPAETPLEC